MPIFQGERPCQEVLLKECAESLNSWLINGGKKARERRAMRQTIASEQGHECRGKRPQAVVECFEGRFSAECVANENRDKIDCLIVTEALTSKADLLCNGVKKTEVSQMMRDDGDLSKP
jgi:hypothetical protein